MPAKRLRIFAGPNGSGKSSLIERIKLNENVKINLGIYVNADEIEKTLRTTLLLNFSDFAIQTTTEELKAFFITSGFSINKTGEFDIYHKINVTNNVLSFGPILMNSYIAADISEFIRQKLVEEGVTFTFETVLSHQNKIALLKHAKAKGFRVYLYYVATDAPEINVDRVKLRVALDGHDVREETIIDRYYRSLELLYDTIKISDRAFMFDNSDELGDFFAEITDGENVEIYGELENVPDWFIKYVVMKSKP